MERTFPDTSYCPVFQSSLEFLGSRWTASILRVLFNGPARFTDVLEAVPRLSSRLLAQRLDELTGAGLVVRAPDEPYAVYRLSESGRDLREVFEAFERWNRRWSVAPGGKTGTPPAAGRT